MKEQVLAGGTPFGRYRLLKLLGQGGMGEVHLALGPGVEGVEKRLAIKRLLPSVAEDGGLVERFLDEARIAVTLSHGNIVPVFEVGRVGREYFLVMECIEGTDLRRLLQHLVAGGRRLPIPLALYIALCVCQALDYVHRKVGPEGHPLGLVHRDVSPQNVLVGFDGEVKLTDFGIARVAGRRQRTATGNLVGKFAYMSPEQASGLPLDGRTDQFALGIVLHEMLTGRRLFDGESDLALLRQVQQATIAVPSSLCPEVPPELDTLVMRMLARDPGARYYPLKVLDGAEKGAVVQVTQRVARLGSDPDGTLALSDPTVSMAHATIEVDVHGYRVDDTGSKNGTLLEAILGPDAARVSGRGGRDAALQGGEAGLGGRLRAALLGAAARALPAQPLRGGAHRRRASQECRVRRAEAGPAWARDVISADSQGAARWSACPVRPSARSAGWSPG